MLKNAFISITVAERKFGPFETLAMPILSTGDHRLPAEQVIPALIKEAVKLLDATSSFEKIMFFARSRERAEQLSVAMSNHLGRMPLCGPTGHVGDALRGELEALLCRALVEDFEGAKLYENMERLLLSRDSQSFEIGALGRRLADYVCARVIVDPKVTRKDLLSQINELPSYGVAHWIATYMHLLRVFGNEEVHHKAEGKSPPFLGAADVMVCLSAICRVLEFWLAYKGRRLRS